MFQLNVCIISLASKTQQPSTGPDIMTSQEI